MADETEWIREAFRLAIRNGPVSGERMRKLIVIIEHAKVRCEGSETSWRDITQPLNDAISQSIQSGQPVLLEPWVKLELSTPEDYVGEVTSILAKRKGRVQEIDSERMLFRVEAEIPVSESFGLANEIRTATSGWATWGAKGGLYREVGTFDPEPEEY